MKTEIPEQGFDHAKITRYDDRQARKRLSELDQLVQKICDAKEKLTEAQKCRDELMKKARGNSAQIDASLLSRITNEEMIMRVYSQQIEELEAMVPPAEAALQDEFDGRIDGLESAVRNLCGFELKRIRDEIAAQLLPIYGIEAKAQHEAVATPRYRKASSAIRVVRSMHRPISDAVRECLYCLDAFNKFGDLEKAANANPEAA